MGYINIKNAEIYTPYKIIKNGNILIKGAKILKVSKGSPTKLPADTIKLDAKGKMLCPGLIDVHLQGAGGFDFLDGTRGALSKICETLARFGTTSFLATTVFKNRENEHIQNIVTMSPRHHVTSKGAQILGIHLEGPFVNLKRKGMIRTNGISGCSLKYLDKILKATAGQLRMMTIAPELKAAIAIIKRLRKKRIVASFGHSDASYDDTNRGIEAGITHATHIFNAMRPIHHRDPGPLPAVLMDDRVSVQLIADGVHVHPAVIRLIVKFKGVKNIALITDSMSSQGLPDGKYVYDGWGYESRDGACRYRDHTLIGTSLPLNKMVKRMAEFSGVSLLETIQMATVNPARILRIDDKKGSIEEGKEADLVVMDKKLDVWMTMVGGQVVYRKTEK
jgi:N-acetylglucosamine-6-phosphate deacetylase